MRKLKFHCENCEADRKVVVKLVGDFYILGVCEICGSKITINRAKAKISA